MKVAEMREKSDHDLQTRERDLREQMFKLNFYRSGGSADGPHRLRSIRQEIAQILTVRGEMKRAAEAQAKEQK